MYETTLGLFDGDEPDTRVELVQVARPGEIPTLEIRLQRNCGSLGWIVQKRIRLAAGQIPDLRGALNLMDPDGRDARRRPQHLTLVDSDKAL